MISAPTVSERPKLRQCFKGLRRIDNVCWPSWRACNKGRQRQTDSSSVHFHDQLGRHPVYFGELQRRTEPAVARRQRTLRCYWMGQLTRIFGLQSNSLATSPGFDRYADVSL